MIKDFISQSGNAIFAQIGLVIFVLLFAAILIWTLRGHKNRFDHERNLPLEDDMRKQETSIHNNE
jgi:cbb3-type cytochrome oxidase subunit 3